MDSALVWKHWLPQANLPHKPSMSGELQEELQLEVFLHLTTVPFTCTNGVRASTLHEGRDVLGKSLSAHYKQQPPRSHAESAAPDGQRSALRPEATGRETRGH